eukprot:4070855-Lingulodinium_polyedra.AAC.1
MAGNERRFVQLRGVCVQLSELSAVVHHVRGPFAKVEFSLLVGSAQRRGVREGDGPIAFGLCREE